MRETEKRNLERFEIEIPAHTTVFTDADDCSVPCPIALTTRNISASGAFFVTEEPVGSGTLLDIDLVLPFSRGGRSIGEKSTIRVRGEVVRVAPDGMAVRFAGQYQFNAG